VTVTEAGAEEALTPQAWAHDEGLEHPDLSVRNYAHLVLVPSRPEGMDPPFYEGDGVRAFRRWRTERVRTSGAGDHVRRLADEVPIAAPVAPPAAPSDKLVIEGLRLATELLAELVWCVSVTPDRHERHKRMLARLEGLVGQVRRATVPDL